MEICGMKQTMLRGKKFKVMSVNIRCVSMGGVREWRQIPWIKQYFTYKIYLTDCSRRYITDFYKCENVLQFSALMNTVM